LTRRKRILILSDLSDELNIPTDINPSSIGLTTQAINTLVKLFTVNGAS